MNIKYALNINVSIFSQDKVKGKDVAQHHQLKSLSVPELSVSGCKNTQDAVASMLCKVQATVDKVSFVHGRPDINEQAGRCVILLHLYYALSKIRSH